MDFKFLYTDANGRISRKTWWLGVIGLFIISLIVQSVLGVAAAASGMAGTAFGVGLFSLISLAVLFIPYYAITLKRLNDRGRPPILFWAFYAPSIASGLLMMLGVSGSMETVQLFGQTAPAFQPNALGTTLGAISIGVGIWALVELGFLRGQSGENAHGRDPLARGETTV